MIDLKEQAGVAMNVRGQFSDPIVDPQVTLGALAFADDLGRLLWRMKYGQDIKRAGMHRAVLLLSKRIRSSGKFGRPKPQKLHAGARLKNQREIKLEGTMGDVVDRFAARVIVEWVADQCTQCNGRGIRFGAAMGDGSTSSKCKPCAGSGRIFEYEEMVPFACGPVGPLVYRHYVRCADCLGRGIALQGRKAEQTKVCLHCAGSGREPISEAERSSALGVTLDIYKRHWHQLFKSILEILDQVDERAADVVRSQLKKAKSCTSEK